MEPYLPQLLERTMSQWKEILIEVEPRGKSFRIGLDESATAADVIEAIEGRCKEEGVDVENWARSQVGRDFQFVLLRRSEGNAILSPSLSLSLDRVPVHARGSAHESTARHPTMGLEPD